MRPTRRFGLAASLSLAVLGGAWAGAWWVAARGVESGVHDWVEAQRAQGIDVRFSALSLGGFPFALRATASDGAITARNLEWSGQAVVAEAPVWDPKTITLTLPGRQRLSIDAGGTNLPARLEAMGGNGRVILGDDGQPVETVLTFADVAVTPMAPHATPAAVKTITLTLTRPTLPPADSQETGLSLAVSADGITLPPEAAALGAAMEKAEAVVRVQGRPPAPEPASLSAWSRNGGTVELERLAVNWGPMRLSLNGTFALDHDLQPQAAMTMEVRGAQETLTALQTLLKPKDVNMARTVLSMLSRPAADDGKPVVTAPVTIQSRALFLGPLRVAAVPEVVW